MKICQLSVLMVDLRLKPDSLTQVLRIENLIFTTKNDGFLAPKLDFQILKSIIYKQFYIKIISPLFKIFH